MRYHFLFLSIISLSATAQLQTSLRYEDKIRIKEAISINKKHGNQIWENFSEVPFSILLVTDSTEYLMYHPRPSKDFMLIEEDEVLKTNIYYRKRVFSPRFLATFPAVNGVPTIVVGTPENTNKNSTEWIITLLHEHFHQFQMSHPNYYSGVSKLNLSGGDQTGMWMLNYPFPYDSLVVINQYKKLTNSINEVINNYRGKQFNKKLKQYVRERNSLKQMLKPADYRYFAFQVWQEGIAMYTEYKFLELLSLETTPSELTFLKDFIPYAELKEKLYKQEINNTSALELKKAKRVAFYSLGFAEGLIMDAIKKNWRKEYLKNMFSVEYYLPKKFNKL